MRVLSLIRSYGQCAKWPSFADGWCAAWTQRAGSSRQRCRVVGVASVRAGARLCVTTFRHYGIRRPRRLMSFRDPSRPRRSSFTADAGKRRFRPVQDHAVPHQTGGCRRRLRRPRGALRGGDRSGCGTRPVARTAASTGQTAGSRTDQHRGDRDVALPHARSACAPCTPAQRTGFPRRARGLRYRTSRGPAQAGETRQLEQRCPRHAPEYRNGTAMLALSDERGRPLPLVAGFRHGRAPSVSMEELLTLASVRDCGSADVIIRHDRCSSEARVCARSSATLARHAKHESRAAWR